MCEPVTAIQGVGLGLNFIQQSQGARAGRRAAAQATESAQAAALDRFTGISQRQRAAQASASADIQAIVRQSLQAQASAQVAAAESGASGNSVQALLADFQRQQAEAEGRIERNLQTEILTGDLEGRAVSRETGARLQNIAASTPQRPNIFQLGLNLAGIAIDQQNRASARLDQAGGR